MNSIVCLLERTAAQLPQAVALEDSDGEMTYKALRTAARIAATALLAHGVKKGGPVAVYLPKSCGCVVSFYAALYCGAPYAPLDYTAPAHRTEKTLQNLRPSCIITNEEGRGKLQSLDLPDSLLLDYVTLTAGQEDEEALYRTVDATVDTDPAYIMYTSGSTGTPKGVVIPHRGVLDYAAFIAESYGISKDTIIGLQSGFHFDNSVFDLYAAVLTWAKVVIIPEILFMYPVKLMEYVAEKRISCVFWVPTVMCSVANSGALDTVALPDLQTVVFAGEVMPNKQLNIWRRALPNCLYSNLYGPTEITVDCTIYNVDREFSDSDPLPIGYARPNMRVLILRDDDTEAAVGETGELCVVGSQLALGYWNNPEETARHFVVNPLNRAFPEPMYRTGDLAYREADGLIQYVGRKDSQIKLRGNRIEMGDIETAARCVPGVSNACAVFDAENERIVLFVETSEALTLRRLNVELGKYIPKYMLPGKLVCMEALPLNANRKIDRVALKAVL